MSGPDKPKVTDEVWSDERVKSFLITEPGTEHSDYTTLQKAYQAMRADDFERFVGFFVAAGGNLNDPNDAGETFLDLVSSHGKSGEYARALESAGAKKSAAAED